MDPQTAVRPVAKASSGSRLAVAPLLLGSVIALGCVQPGGGTQGPAGPQGATGPQGPPGAPGRDAIPNVPVLLDADGGALGVIRGGVQGDPEVLVTSAGCIAFLVLEGGGAAPSALVPATSFGGGSNPVLYDGPNCTGTAAAAGLYGASIEGCIAIGTSVYRFKQPFQKQSMTVSSVLGAAGGGCQPMASAAQSVWLLEPVSLPITFGPFSIGIK